jgi:hypothetical protein
MELYIKFCPEIVYLIKHKRLHGIAVDDYKLLNIFQSSNLCICVMFQY